MKKYNVVIRGNDGFQSHKVMEGLNILDLFNSCQIDNYIEACGRVTIEQLRIVSINEL